MKKIILIGGGGHCDSVIDVIEAEGEFQIVGILDQKETSSGNYPVVGKDDDIKKFVDQDCYFLITVGNLGELQPRQKIIQLLEKNNAKIATVISPNAHVSPYSKIGEGTVVHHHALVNTKSVIGKHCIINSGSLVEHGVEIGSNTHLSTASVVNGNCKIGSNCLIGSSSVIKHTVHICDAVVVGMGAVVTKNIQSIGVYTGCPARLVGEK